MTRFHPLRRGSRILPVAAATVATALTTLVLTASGPAGADNPAAAPAVPAPPAVPTSASQIQNIDQVKTAIKGYYGDTVTTTMDPVNGTTALHTFNPAGNYAAEMDGIVTDAEKYLAKPKPTGVYPTHKATKAVLFDVDDTLLNTYNYEIYSNFVYNPTTNAAFVDSPNYQLRAVPHMVALENWAAAHHYAVFFLTGRPIGQLGGTQSDLHGAGYVFDDANVYTKDPAAPWLSSCSNGMTVTCTTTQYKSLTRQHIESLGYEIVANFGDQFSDLNGGFADNTFKIPNPMYFLP
jgi:putative acid phosphatase of HAD superfamily subfamily IIIB